MDTQWQILLKQGAMGIGRGFSSIGTGLDSLALWGHARRWVLLPVLLLLGIGYALYRHPPFTAVDNGEIGVRTNMLLGTSSAFRTGPVFMLYGVHRLQRYSLRDQVYRPERSAQANGPAAFQSMEGLSLGVDLTIRYALDPTHIRQLEANAPDDIGAQLVEPQVRSVIYRTFTRYSVKEIYASKRAEIQQAIITELRPLLAAQGILLRGVEMGNVDLPADYRQGLQSLLSEEIESQKMQYTLELKAKQVKESELEADAQKVRREKAAEAAGNEQIIAARAQEEAMKHVLPFKQKQIEQRRLEAEAEKTARIKTAEGNAEARRIEAQGEADARTKLADAEAYRLEHINEIESKQLERDGELLSKNPLLIQKTMADKLSDKVSVIIAPTPQTGGFIGSALLGQTSPALSAHQ